MDIFPTQYSTLSSLALKDFLELQYGFVQMKCRLLIHNVSDTYLLEGESTKYIFKIYRDSHRKLAEIKAEVELLNSLNENGASVAYPIKALDGEQIQSFNAAEGIRYGVLFSYALGKPIYDLSTSHLETLGREMAKIHQITASLQLENPRKSYTVETMITQPIEILKPAFKELQEEYILLQTMAGEVIDKLSQFNLQGFGYGYCHYDFLPKNFHFQENGKLTFFDFDFMGKGHFINDITSFNIHYFLECCQGKISQEQALQSFQVFLSAYRELMPLSTEELKAIPYFGFGFWVFYLGFHYENFDDWSSLFFGPRYLKERVALIKKWLEWSTSNHFS